MLESQGTFKHQHDTDKNLKFMHVYPRVTIAEGGASSRLVLLCFTQEIPLSMTLNVGRTRTTSPPSSAP